MELDERTYELIEQYLNGELKGQELIDFEKRIESIPQLKEEMNINRELLAHFNEGHVVETTDPNLEKMYKAKEVKEFKNKLKDTLVEHNKQNPIIKKEATVRKLSWKPIALAASILLLVGFFYISNLKSEVSPGILFAQNFKQEPLTLTTKGDAYGTISQIERAYNNKDFVAAEKLLSPLLETLTENHPFWFNLQLSHGITLLELGENKEAEAIFDTLRRSDSMDAPKGNWYYILTLLKRAEKEKVLKEINLYLEGGGTYKAEELRKIKEQL